MVVSISVAAAVLLEGLSAAYHVDWVHSPALFGSVRDSDGVELGVVSYPTRVSKSEDHVSGPRFQLRETFHLAAADHRTVYRHLYLHDTESRTPTRIAYPVLPPGGGVAHCRRP